MASQFYRTDKIQISGGGLTSKGKGKEVTEVDTYGWCLDSTCMYKPGHAVTHKCKKNEKIKFFILNDKCLS